MHMLYWYKSFYFILFVHMLHWYNLTESKNALHPNCNCACHFWIRTRRTAVKLVSWCVTSIRAVDTAVSSITWFTASWSLMAPRESWSSSPTTGVTLPKAGRRSSSPSATPVRIDPEPRPDTGQVSADPAGNERISTWKCAWSQYDIALFTFLLKSYFVWLISVC